MTSPLPTQDAPRTWDDHMKLLLSPKGAPSVALWGVLTGVQVGIVALLLTSANTHDLARAVGAARLPPEVIVGLVVCILALSLIRSTVLTPMATVLMQNKHVGLARALRLSWSRAGRVIGAVFATGLFTTLGGSVAVMLDVPITSFVELPCLVTVCLIPFLVASGKGFGASFWGALRTSRAAWPQLLMLFVLLQILGSTIELSAMEPSSLWTLPKGARLFVSLFSLEAFSMIASVSLYATVIKKHRGQ